MTKPFVDWLYDGIEELSAENDHLRAENERLRAARVGYSQQTVDALQVEVEALRTENERLRERLALALEITAEQAEDEGLWFRAQTAAEAYLQQELRRLHAAVEGERCR